MAKNATPSQKIVPIKEIRDGVIVMKDGTLRMLLLASSVNMALKSADEQSAILAQFQTFLNSLDFSLQIFIQSREYDVRPYIALLEKQEKAQTNDLMKIQIREYINFVRNFTEQTNIMTKSFFLVVPFTPSVSVGSKTGIFEKLLGKSTKKEKKEDELKEFNEQVSQLEQRVNVIIQGLARTGVRTVKLDTESVIEALYRLYNPGDQEKPISMEKG